ncbi:hypothetical protein HDE_00389 [Halotydeus destructor]|nr:hypothetical protein HDE_00389 [Halotydeus destructor]
MPFSLDLNDMFKLVEEQDVGKDGPQLGVRSVAQVERDMLQEKARRLAAKTQVRENLRCPSGVFCDRASKMAKKDIRWVTEELAHRCGHAGLPAKHLKHPVKRMTTERPASASSVESSFDADTCADHDHQCSQSEDHGNGW